MRKGRAPDIVIGLQLVVDIEAVVGMSWEGLDLACREWTPQPG